MKIINSLAHLKFELAKIADQNIGFVPTMGALHNGHLSLVEIATKNAELTLVSIFINDKQFAPNEDLNIYPRRLSEDIQKLRERSVDFIFVPPAEEIYPAGFQTYVSNIPQAHSLCGESRPHHFRGVLTVVLKFLLLIKPSLLVLGKKDYQQLVLVSRMIEDFHLPIQVLGGATQRDSKGIALSSRNTYLNAEQRNEASIIYQALEQARKCYLAGERKPAQIIQACATEIQKSSHIVVEYLELRHQKDLTEINAPIISAPCVLLIAVHIGSTRLIDNVELG